MKTSGELSACSSFANASGYKHGAQGHLRGNHSKCGCSSKCATPQRYEKGTGLTALEYLPVCLTGDAGQDLCCDGMAACK